MASLQIKGVPGFDGTYPIDEDKFTHKDFRIIKKSSGVRAAELGEAMEAGDLDVVIAVAKVVLRHADHPHWSDFDAAVDELPVGKVELDFLDEEPKAKVRKVS